MRHLLLALTLTCSAIICNAQIAWSHTDLVEEYGYDFTKEYIVNEDGTQDYTSWILTWRLQKSTQASGDYIQELSAYMTLIEDGEPLCYQVRYVEPLSEANSWISFYNEQGYVKTPNELEWIDYGGKRQRNIYIDETCRVYVRYFNPSK